MTTVFTYYYASPEAKTQLAADEFGFAYKPQFPPGWEEVDHEKWQQLQVISVPYTNIDGLAVDWPTEEDKKTHIKGLIDDQMLS